MLLCWSYLSILCFETHELPKDGILQKVISIWMQLCSVAHFSVIKIRIGAISCTADCTADCTHSNFDGREMGNWTELHSYWNYFLQNTIFSTSVTIYHIEMIFCFDLDTMRKKSPKVNLSNYNHGPIYLPDQFC